MSTERDPNGVDPHAPGSKLDAGKVRPWLMMSGFARALAAVADVTTKGAEKYTPGGWAHVDGGVERYMEGFARHALALGRGETLDVGPGGTGCLHKAQMIWNLLASLELELRQADAWGKDEMPAHAGVGCTGDGLIRSRRKVESMAALQVDLMRGVGSGA